MLKQLALFLIFLAIAFAAWQFTRPPDEFSFDAEVVSSDIDLPTLGFQNVVTDYEFTLPQDAQPHPEFPRERWQLDLSACLDTEAAFVTWERLSLLPEALSGGRESAWALNQVMIGTATLPALTETRYSRMNLELAGATKGRVWLENWAFTWNPTATEFQVMLGDTLTGTFTTTDAPTATTADSYHALEYALTGRFNNTNCTATLQHTFGAMLP